jgi:ribosomal protein S18 acetylase RimI-like enzyme
MACSYPFGYQPGDGRSKARQSRSTRHTAGVTAVRVIAPASVDEAARWAGPAHELFDRLVRDGAALGWVQPPTRAEVADLLTDAAAAAARGDGGLRVAVADHALAGLGYWLRYRRPTRQPHGDVERVAVDPRWQGRGVGRALTSSLVDSARAAGVEQLTLDVRGDNVRAARLYESLGFRRYGVLEDFVAVGDDRFDTLFYAIDLRPPGR